MTIQEISKAIDTLKSFLKKEGFEGELHIHTIEVFKPAPSESILIDVEFDRDNQIDFLQLRTFDKETFEVWGYGDDEPESITPKLKQLYP